ncbi:hypothetical protein PAMA_007087 [Pampus argenteus]
MPPRGCVATCYSFSLSPGGANKDSTTGNQRLNASSAHARHSFFLSDTRAKETRWAISSSTGVTLENSDRDPDPGRQAANRCGGACLVMKHPLDLMNLHNERFSAAADMKPAWLKCKNELSSFKVKGILQNARIKEYKKQWQYDRFFFNVSCIRGIIAMQSHVGHCVQMNTNQPPPVCLGLRGDCGLVNKQKQCESEWKKKRYHNGPTDMNRMNSWAALSLMTPLVISGKTDVLKILLQPQGQEHYFTDDDSYQRFQGVFMCTPPPPHHCLVVTDSSFHLFINLISLISLSRSHQPPQAPVSGLDRTIYHAACSRLVSPSITKNLPVEAKYRRLLTRSNDQNHIYNKQISLPRSHVLIEMLTNSNTILSQVMSLYLEAITYSKSRTKLPGGSEIRAAPTIDFDVCPLSLHLNEEWECIAPLVLCLCAQITIWESLISSEARHQHLGVELKSCLETAVFATTTLSCRVGLFGVTLKNSPRSIYRCATFRRSV